MKEMKGNVSVVHLIVATGSSGPPASGKIIKEMPGSVASGTPYVCLKGKLNTHWSNKMNVVKKVPNIIHNAELR